MNRIILVPNFIILNNSLDKQSAFCIFFRFLILINVHILQVFFRPGIIANLDERRDERSGAIIIKLQAAGRAYLARRKLKQLKVCHRMCERGVRGRGGGGDGMKDTE